MSRPVATRRSTRTAQGDASNSGRSVRIPWLDSPEVDRSDLLPPFKPTLEKVPKEKLGAAVNVPPFDTLPRILVPSSRSRLRPPVLHCGWEVNASLLLAYAKAKNVPVMQRPWLYKGEGKDKSEDEREEESEREDEKESEEEEESAYTGKSGIHVLPDSLLRDPRKPKRIRAIDDLHPMYDVVAYHRVLRDALLGLVREVDPNWPEDMISIKRTLNAGTPLLMSLFTNYKLLKAPSSETVRAIGRKLGKEDLPKWYLDLNDWKWRHLDRGPLY